MNLDSSLIVTQFQTVKEKWPGAKIALIGDGSHLVTVPLPLIDGWNKKKVTARFVVPVGFPCARPEHFWVDEVGLRRVDGAPPQWTQLYPCPLQSEPLLFFLYRVSAWSPNGDTLYTYVNVIRQRLMILR